MQVCFGCAHFWAQKNGFVRCDLYFSNNAVKKFRCFAGDHNFGRDSLGNLALGLCKILQWRVPHSCQLFVCQATLVYHYRLSLLFSNDGRNSPRLGHIWISSKCQLCLARTQHRRPRSVHATWQNVNTT